MMEQNGDADDKRNGGADAALDPSQVLTVGHSHVMGVVVSRVLQQVGLRAVTALPAQAQELLETLRPGMVVLDGEADNSACHALVDAIASLRRARGGRAPAVLLLSTRNPGPALPHPPAWPDGVIDAVVAKPITSERLLLAVQSLRPDRKG